MAWKHHIPIVLFGSVVIANCTSTAPPPAQEEEECNGVWQSGDTDRICRTDVPGGGTSGNAGSGYGAMAGVVPNLGTGGSTGGSVPTLGGNGGSGSGAEAGVGNVGQGGVAGVGIGGVGGDGTGAVAGSGNPGGMGMTGGTGGTGAPVVLGRIQVNAGTKNRDHTPVSFPFPAGNGKNLVLNDPMGAAVAMQQNPVDMNFYFIVPSLPANQQVIYTVEELPAAPPAAVTSVVEGNQLFFSVGTTRLFRWTLTADNFRNRAANDVRSGYIYPLYTPGGLNVADDYASDHPHMHGLWSAWTSTTFRNHKVDFWNGYANQGHVDLTSMEGAWAGQVHGGLIANIQHDDITLNPPVTALREKWVVTIFKTHDGAPPYFLFDIDSVQLAAHIAEKRAKTGTPFFISCAVSPFKYQREDLLYQYLKLEKKIAAGADMAITQVGWDATKFVELKRYLDERGLKTPVLGNVYVLTRRAAERMNTGNPPGCWASDELVAALRKESEAPDGGLQARLERAAKSVAILKGIGYAGAYIGGTHDARHINQIIRRAEELAPKWEEIFEELQFGKKDGFYLYQRDPRPKPARW